MEILDQLAHERHQIQLLLEGSVDYIEAGDCRIPGQHEALRAIASGDAERPISLYEADQVPGVDNVAIVGIEEAIAKLLERKSQLTGSSGPAVRVFTVKNRKSRTFA